ncbi:hypothetical protein KIN20_033044 [Parelaphostrongylus tenuis]|uniref:Uncharacterized protein n=1 Tax=Parelaphostrongylus tenuis TaxID=148309 RepID=A0AAD5R815_PARTN|nr:hypothetical protein KIN20_033044 [Parelaphostrongylus tenuis]
MNVDEHKSSNCSQTNARIRSCPLPVTTGVLLFLVLIAIAAFFVTRAIRDRRRNHGEYRPQFEELHHAKDLPYLQPPAVEVGITGGGRCLHSFLRALYIIDYRCLNKIAHAEDEFDISIRMLTQKPSLRGIPPMIAPFLLLFLITGAFLLSCKDQNNRNVDWFIVYKMPMEEDNSVPGIRKGVGWYYLDANHNGSLNASSHTLDDENQAVAYTLKQLYNQKKDSRTFHVMYNDEPYNDTFSSDPISSKYNRVQDEYDEYGHTKGVTFFDGQSGVWLVHSVPKFPPPDSYHYPASGHHYGQTMLCLSLSYSQLEKIATQLYYNRPNIYSSHLPKAMAYEFGILDEVIAGKYKEGEPYHSIVELTTVGGQTFKSFAKTHLYDGLVAPTLMTNLIAETWRRGDQVPLDCSATYHTNDALKIQVGSTTPFKYTKDHSKMARSTYSSKPWLCIGDINRMTSQYVRGGGTICISEKALWEAFKVIKQVNHC